MVNVADPLGGAWYVEALTDRIEAQAEEIFAEIRALGERRQSHGEHPIGPITSGLLAGVETGWFTGNIADAAFDYQRALEDGRKRIVGVNVHTTADDESAGHPADLPRGRDGLRSPPLRRESRRATRRRSRSRCPCSPRRPAEENLVPLLIDAARAEVTLGEMCDVLREVGHLPGARTT